MKISRCLIALLLGMAIVSSNAFAQRRSKGGPAASGEMLSQSCFACHGSKGASIAGPMPTIGGQNETYLFNTLRQYKGNRPATVMGRLMKAYSDDEISAISKYLSELPYVRAEQPVDAAKVELGMKAYQKACKDCHPKGGREASEAEYPLVAGQWLPFLKTSLGEVLGHQRPVDDKYSTALEKLNKDELDAVLNYFAAQR